MKLKFSSIIACASLLLSGCAIDSRVSLVQNGYLDGCRNATLKEMVDGYIGSPKWSAGVSDDGQEFVNIEGNIMYSEKEVDLILQYLVNSEKETFEFSALELNDIPQNAFIAAALLSNMCDEVSK
tara:strand:- start:1307 stop:1681 length:375 start_codon:yes stop_codon:yes gene_type:complete